MKYKEYISCFLIIMDNYQNSTFLPGVKIPYTIYRKYKNRFLTLATVTKVSVGARTRDSLISIMTNTIVLTWVGMTSR